MSHLVGTLPAWSSWLPPVAPGPIHDGAPGRAGTGREVLTLLRGDVSVRPNFDPGLAGGLRAWLEDAAYRACRPGRPRRPVDARISAVARCATRGGGRSPLTTSRRRLVHVLFRLLVHGVDITHPLDDALEAVRAAGDASRARRSSRCLRRHGTASPVRWQNTSRTSPSSCRASLPGGCPGPMTTSPSRWPEGEWCSMACSTSWSASHKQVRHPCARSGCPPVDPGPVNGGRCTSCRCSRPCGRGSPFPAGTLESATGRYAVEDIREEHLRAMATHIAAWLAHGALDHG